MTVKSYSFDLYGEHAADLMQEQPYGDVLDNCRNGELDAGHAGPPCGSFSIVRHRADFLQSETWGGSISCHPTLLSNKRRQTEDPCWLSGRRCCWARSFSRSRGGRCLRQGPWRIHRGVRRKQRVQCGHSPKWPTLWRSFSAARRGSTPAHFSARRGSGGWNQLSLEACLMGWNPWGVSAHARETSSTSPWSGSTGQTSLQGTQTTSPWSMPGWSSMFSGRPSTWNGGVTWRSSKGPSSRCCRGTG